MIISSQKLYTKYKKLPRAGKEDDLLNDEFEPDPHYELLAPEAFPAPFPSPSPAMQELGLNLLIPPPPPSPLLQYSDIEDEDELGLTRTVTAIFKPKDSERGTSGSPELRRTQTAVYKPVPPLSIATQGMEPLKCSFESPSMSQCPTPRPQSAIGIRTSCSSKQSRARSTASNILIVASRPFTTEVVDGSGQGGYPMEILGRKKVVWAPDEDSTAPNIDPSMTFAMTGHSSIAGDIAIWSVTNTRRNVKFGRAHNEVAPSTKKRSRSCEHWDEH